MPALSGASNIYGAGMLELGMSFSMEQLVIDNDIIGMIKYSQRGIEVSADTLAYEVIREVGIGNDFLSHSDTMANVGLPSQPRVIDRNGFDAWRRDGSKDITHRAHDVVASILATHQCVPLDASAKEEINNIIKRADAQFYKN
jgi:trimethylamine--corrinoid protein Co-methyltransferase